MADRSKSGSIVNEQQEAEYVAQSSRELDAARAALGTGDSWDIANRLVKQFRPVPWLLWTIIRSVYGRPDRLGRPDPIMFDPVMRLVKLAAVDKTIGAKGGSADQLPGSPEEISLEAAVNAIGYDVSAALCFIHGLCRRISVSVAERVWKPIIDDALLRAHIGYYIGLASEPLGPGRGLLAGFSGRSGLAIQIACAEPNQVQRTLEGLAAGMQLREVGMNVFGCDPLQVSAMALTAAGCSSESAFGIASYSETGTRTRKPTEGQLYWLSAFALTEHLRMGRQQNIEEVHWRRLRLDSTAQADIKNRIQQLQRKGHGWGWLVSPLT